MDSCLAIDTDPSSQNATVDASWKAAAPVDVSHQPMVVVPHKVIHQLSSVLYHLTTTIQAATLQQHLTHSTPDADDSTEALSYVSEHQQNPTSALQDTPPTVVSNSYTHHTPASTTKSGTSLPPGPPRIKEKIISGEFIDLATLLPKAIFSSSSESETSRSI